MLSGSFSGRRKTAAAAAAVAAEDVDAAGGGGIGHPDGSMHPDQLEVMMYFAAAWAFGASIVSDDTGRSAERFSSVRSPHCCVCCSAPWYALLIVIVLACVHACERVQLWRSAFPWVRWPASGGVLDYFFVPSKLSSPPPQLLTLVRPAGIGAANTYDGSVEVTDPQIVSWASVASGAVVGDSDSMHTIIVPTSSFRRLTMLTSLLVRNDFSVMFAGDAGLCCVVCVVLMLLCSCLVWTSHVGRHVNVHECVRMCTQARVRRC